MKTKLFFIAILLCGIPFAGLWEGAASADPDNGQLVRETAKGILVFGVDAGADFSDLDVRDAQNRPVHDASARRQLASLFAENLFQLTVIAPPHAIRQAVEMAEAFCALLLKSFIVPFPRQTPAIVAAAQSSFRRFVHNVDNLWATCFVGIFFSALLLTATLRFRTPLSVPMRC